MIVQEKAFLQGVFDVFAGTFLVPPPPLPQAWQPQESGFFDDTDNLQNDWLVVGNYLNDAINEHGRSIAEQR